MKRSSPLMSRQLLAVGLVLIVPCWASASGQPGPPRVGTFDVSVETPGGGNRIQVFYAVPARIDASTRIVFVMHGNRRDADHYRDIWAPYARACGLLVVAPAFSSEQFPGFWHYQMGSAYTAAGERVAAGQTDYAVLERIFDAVRNRFHVKARTYDIFGHSAGAQFVHRMILFSPHARIDTAIAANAGTYTVPDAAASLPFGLQDARLSAQDLAHAYAARLWVLVGGEDTNPASRALNRSAAAMAQGANRLQRGRYFFRAAEQAAHEAGVPFNWRFQVVAHVGHNPAGMSAAAARILGCP